MKKQLKLQAQAVILAILASSSYADDNCFDYEKSLHNMFNCFQNRLDIQRLQLDTQQAQIGKLVAKNQNQQKQIAFLTKENQRLQKLMTLPEKYENVRAFITKNAVDKICPKGTKAAHVPLSFRDKTGNEICAANEQKEKSCQSVIYRYVTNDNRHGGHSKTNKSCQQPVERAWPWGNQFPLPNTLSGEWGFGSTWIVCCKR